jgi:hypothetical protein
MSNLQNPFECINEKLENFNATLNQIVQNQTTTTPGPLILTGDQIQEKLNITRQTLFRWRKQKRIPFIQVGSIIRYDFHKIVEALEKNKG